jgi:transposase
MVPSDNKAPAAGAAVRRCDGPRIAGLTKALSHPGTPSQLHLAYEAGPCGCAFARELIAHGYRCELIAVAKMPRKPGERIKTDRRDALALARYLRSGELAPVTIPDARDEALRALSRARDDAARARRKTRQQLEALLLRHGHRYTGKTSWNAVHVRRVLIESAWSYRYSPRMSRERVVRCEGQPKVIRDLAWKAQLRLCSRYRKLSARGVHQNEVCAATARESARHLHLHRSRRARARA